MNFSKSFIHYSKVFQSGPTNEANVLIEIKYDVGKTTADGRAATHNGPHRRTMGQSNQECKETIKSNEWVM